jgi:F-type H+-transporting ATPase subunit delta
VSAEPIDASGLAGRYATALFDLADESNVFDQVKTDLASLQAMLAESADLARVLISPVIGRDEQAKAIDAVMDRAGFGDLTRRFVNAVAANRRLFALPAMMRIFNALLARQRGEMTAEVTSAQPLGATQKTALEEALCKSVGGSVTVQARVDPEILGGLIVKLGSRMVDSSLRTKLQKLQLALKGAA